MFREIEQLYRKKHFDARDREIFNRFLDLLDSGQVRAAEPSANQWRVNAWVKMGILVGFRMGTLKEQPFNGLSFFDKDTYPLKKLQLESAVRLVPGGSAIRRGAYVAPGVTCMPPMYINVGAFVDEGTMVDSHALVGSCAQVGKRVHLSAAAQIGGVLEPIGALPVIIEDEVLVGGNCGVYEGTIVRRGAVLAAGVILTRGTAVYDLVRESEYRGSADTPLEIPEGAVVVTGTRAVQNPYGRERGLSIYSPIIIKYRDWKTEKSVQLESWLR
ncbi:MAG: 2,3,4,5-tetrahydropyridine-2,6-dicarboxylate N-succinyltransferase [Acidobacteria bacterium]|nr:2,3,4,5-tetrahydropyridine-2,6-dicarboxylate N-succinyltransferase [Acidobacteriota bacterium]